MTQFEVFSCFLLVFKSHLISFFSNKPHLISQPHDFLLRPLEQPGHCTFLSQSFLCIFTWFIFLMTVCQPTSCRIKPKPFKHGIQGALYLGLNDLSCLVSCRNRLPILHVNNIKWGYWHSKCIILHIHSWKLYLSYEDVHNSQAFFIISLSWNMRRKGEREAEVVPLRTQKG